MQKKCARSNEIFNLFKLERSNAHKIEVLEFAQLRRFPLQIIKSIWKWKRWYILNRLRVLGQRPNKIYSWRAAKSALNFLIIAVEVWWKFCAKYSSTIIFFMCVHSFLSEKSKISLQQNNLENIYLWTAQLKILKVFYFLALKLSCLSLTRIMTNVVTVLPYFRPKLFKYSCSKF